jgi:predicted transport protein
MSTEILDTFELLNQYILEFENVDILYLKTCIQFKIGATFLSVYPRKDRLVLEYQFNQEEDCFPVFKCIRISKNRVLHRLVIAEPSDFDTQIKEWIKAAYWTVRKK